MNIKNKIILSISTVSAVSLIIIGAIMYSSVSKIITNRVEETLTVSLDNNTSIMLEWLNGKSNGLKMMKDTVLSGAPNGIDTPDMLLSYKNDKDISALFVAYDDKTLITEQKLPPGFDATTRPWFIGAKETNGLYVTEPFIDRSNGKNAISISHPIVFPNGRSGVIAENIGLSSILDKFKEVKLIGNGYLIVLDKVGTFILHPNEELLGKNLLEVQGLEELSKKVLENESGMENYVFDGANKIMMWKTIPGTSWKIEAVVDTDVAYVQKRATLILTLVIFLVTSIISVIIGLIIARSIGKPIEEITKSCDLIASGDFTNEIDERLLNRKDEVGTLAKGFKKIEESINQIIKDITISINSIAISSNELSEKISIISKGAKNQANNTADVSDSTISFKTSMDKVLDNVRNQVAGIEETASSISEISHTVNIVAKNADVTRVISDKAAISSKEGNSKVEEALRSMSEMEDVTKKIEDAVKGINSISEQTNLLALNAAIEAARAGDAGKGFAVVADEVKKLAENSKKFTESIVHLINDLRNKTDENYKLSSYVGDNLKDITEKVLNTNKELKEVAEAMKIQDGSIKEISEAINNISTGSSNVESLVMEEIERLHDTITSIDSIAEVAQETANNTDKILEASSSLAQETANMKEAISKIKIK